MAIQNAPKEQWIYSAKNSFSSGELTPTIEGRNDLPIYQHGAKKLINFMILPSGGITRRHGTCYAHLFSEKDLGIKCMAVLPYSREYSFLIVFSPTEDKKTKIEYFINGEGKAYELDDIEVALNVEDFSYTVYQGAMYISFGINYPVYQIRIDPECLKNKDKKDKLELLSIDPFKIDATIFKTGKEESQSKIFNNLLNKKEDDLNEFLKEVKEVKADGKVVKESLKELKTSVVSFFEGRLWCFGSDKNIHEIWASSLGDASSFNLAYGSLLEARNPLSAFAVTFSSNTFDSVLWSIPFAKELLVGTTDGVYVLKTGDRTKNEFVKIHKEVEISVAPIKPIICGKSIFFVEGDTKKINSLYYSEEKGGYQVSCVTTYSEHLFSGGIRQIVGVNSPFSMIFAVLNNGSFATFTYSQDLKIMGWAQHWLGGDGYIAEAITISGEDSDKVFFRVRRGGVDNEGNKTIKEHLEYFDCKYLTAGHLAKIHEPLYADCYSHYKVIDEQKKEKREDGKEEDIDLSQADDDTVEKRFIKVLPIRYPNAYSKKLKDWVNDSNHAAWGLDKIKRQDFKTMRDSIPIFEAEIRAAAALQNLSEVKNDLSDFEKEIEKTANDCFKTDLTEDIIKEEFYIGHRRLKDAFSNDELDDCIAFILKYFNESLKEAQILLALYISLLRKYELSISTIHSFFLEKHGERKCLAGIVFEVKNIREKIIEQYNKIADINIPDTLKNLSNKQIRRQSTDRYSFFVTGIMELQDNHIQYKCDIILKKIKNHSIILDYCIGIKFFDDCRNDLIEPLALNINYHLLKKHLLINVDNLNVKEYLEKRNSAYLHSNLSCFRKAAREYVISDFLYKTFDLEYLGLKFIGYFNITKDDLTNIKPVPRKDLIGFCQKQTDWMVRSVLESFGARDLTIVNKVSLNIFKHFLLFIIIDDRESFIIQLKEKITNIISLWIKYKELRGKHEHKKRAEDNIVAFYSNREMESDLSDGDEMYAVQDEQTNEINILTERLLSSEDECTTQEKEIMQLIKEANEETKKQAENDEETKMLLILQEVEENNEEVLLIDNFPPDFWDYLQKQLEKITGRTIKEEVTLNKENYQKILLRFCDKSSQELKEEFNYLIIVNNLLLPKQNQSRQFLNYDLTHPSKIDQYLLLNSEYLPIFKRNFPDVDNEMMMLLASNINASIKVISRTFISNKYGNLSVSCIGDNEIAKNTYEELRNIHPTLKNSKDVNYHLEKHVSFLSFGFIYNSVLQTFPLVFEGEFDYMDKKNTQIGIKFFNTKGGYVEESENKDHLKRQFIHAPRLNLDDIKHYLSDRQYLTAEAVRAITTPYISGWLHFSVNRNISKDVDLVYVVNKPYPASILKIYAKTKLIPHYLN